jgi:hypothetical protein
MAAKHPHTYYIRNPTTVSIRRAGPEGGLSYTELVVHGSRLDDDSAGHGRLLGQAMGRFPEWRIGIQPRNNARARERMDGLGFGMTR